ncbi:MAG TPA: hypothetical protein VFJ85_01290 [Acidimicrobiales bacterium]|nr:hypothetical protein [Acidimicrobiales bacterium]
MPHVAGIEVRRAWRHRNEVGRIHYIVTSHEGVERHLYERDDSALGRLLDAALLAQGYTGPKSAQDDDEGASVPLEE